ncbi:MAG: ribonuclease [Hyphomicrobiales bacterium]|nr:ribonuclease [Hyphomicrobiales bacterium]
MTDKIFERLSLCLAIFALCFVAAPGNAASNDTRGGASGSSRFDFYVLSLSWSPSYCAAAGEKANRYQCGKRPAYGFVVHGLWPQYEHGYPRDCRSDAVRRVPKERMNALSDLMPGYGLIIHEWRTHGMCTGLSQETYFATLRKAYESVEIPSGFQRDDRDRVKPSDIEAAFIAANPGLPANGISIDCDRKYLREVRICMTKDMHFRPCRELERASCHATSVQMPPS